MSESVKVGLFLYGLWFIGFIFLISGDRGDPQFRQFYLWLPILAPFAAMIVLQVLVWIGEALGKYDH